MIERLSKIEIGEDNNIKVMREETNKLIKELSIEKLLFVELQETKNELCNIEKEKNFFERELEKIKIFFEKEKEESSLCRLNPYFVCVEKELLEKIRDWKETKNNKITELREMYIVKCRQNDELVKKLTQNDISCLFKDSGDICFEEIKKGKKNGK